MVVGLRIRFACGRERIGPHRRLVPSVHHRTVARVRVVEEVTAEERHLITAAPRVGVIDAEGVHARHAALRPNHVLTHAAPRTSAARTARDTHDVLEREVLLVDVVEESDDRDAAVAVEQIDVAARHVLVARLGLRIGIVTVAGVELAELPLPHVLVRDDVDGLIALAVVHARELGRIGEFVVDLDVLHRLGRQRLDGRGHVLAEKLLAIDEDLLDLLALRLDRAVGHRDAGHLLQEPFDIGVARNLERIGIVAHRIAALRGAHRLDLLDHGLDLHARPQTDRAQRARRTGDVELGRIVVVAEERHAQLVLAVGESRDRNGPLVGRGRILLLVRIGRRGDRQHGARDRIAGLVVDDRRREGSPLGEGRRREERE